MDNNNPNKTESIATLKNNMRTSKVAITLSFDTQALTNSGILTALEIGIEGDNEKINGMTCLEDLARFEKLTKAEFKANPILTCQRNLLTNVINLTNKLGKLKGYTDGFTLSDGASESLLTQRGITETDGVTHGSNGGTIKKRR